MRIIDFFRKRLSDNLETPISVQYKSISNEDLHYIELAKDFKKASETCGGNLKMMNFPNERLCNHESKYPNHIKIDWTNSTSKIIKFHK